MSLFIRKWEVERSQVEAVIEQFERLANAWPQEEGPAEDAGPCWRGLVYLKENENGG
jgi:hypothetical protein